jgi:phage gp16-like protein
MPMNTKNLSKDSVRSSTPSRTRNSMGAGIKNHIAAIHVVRGALVKAGLMTEEDYRVLARAVTGCDSSASMSLAQRQRFLSHLRGLQVRHGLDKPRVGAARAPSPQAAKAFALWTELHHLGAVRDGSARALNSYARRQTSVARVEWLDDAQLTSLIESLKKWRERVRRASSEQEAA